MENEEEKRDYEKPEILKSVVTTAHNALRGSAVINGGLAFSTLSLIAHCIFSDQYQCIENAGFLFAVAGFSGIGLVASVLGTYSGYLSQHCYYLGNVKYQWVIREQKTWYLVAKWFHGFAIISAFVSLFLFVCAALIAYCGLYRIYICCN